MFEIQGKLYKVFDTVNVSDTFKKREFVILIEDLDTPKYNDYLKFQLTQKNCSLLDTLKLNSFVVVKFKLTGREWNDKYFTNAVALSVANITGCDEFESEAKTFY